MHPPLKLDRKNCVRKRRYSDELSARAGAQLSLDDWKHQEVVWIYQCNLCAGWHITRKDNGTRYRITREHIVQPPKGRT